MFFAGAVEAAARVKMAIPHRLIMNPSLVPDYHRLTSAKCLATDWQYAGAANRRIDFSQMRNGLEQLVQPAAERERDAGRNPRCKIP